MATIKTLFTGRRELTMEEYEALPTIDINKDYNITDYPNFNITNDQMEFALTCVRLFPEGTTFVCSDDGTYSKDRLYRIKIVEDVKTWEQLNIGGGSVTTTDKIEQNNTNPVTSGGLYNIFHSKRYW